MRLYKIGKVDDEHVLFGDVDFYVVTLQLLVVAERAFVHATERRGSA